MSTKEARRKFCESDSQIGIEPICFSEQAAQFVQPLVKMLHRSFFKDSGATSVGLLGRSVVLVELSLFTSPHSERRPGVWPHFRPAHFREIGPKLSLLNYKL